MREFRQAGIVSLLLSAAAVALALVPLEFQAKRWLLAALILAVPALYLAELLIRLNRSELKRLYLRKNVVDFIVLAIVLLMSLYSAYLYLVRQTGVLEFVPLGLVVLRNAYIVAGRLYRDGKASAVVRSFSAYPARSIVLSFLAVILTGAILLLMPFSVTGEQTLRPIDALFTATSAVCVTGLIVVDTATAFTFWGQLVILTLIQIGGLGFMMLSYFVIFMFRRSVSVEERLLISFMLSESDMGRLRRNLISIVLITFSIEALGALALSAPFTRELGMTGEAAFNSAFHAVSAFCNAGFSIRSDNLESFASTPAVLLPVASLIILGGLSFSVILSLLTRGAELLDRTRNGTRGSAVPLPPNTKVVLAGTALLLTAGTILTYALEHGGTLRALSTADQYLNAFFQSVTYRTAGFNSISFGTLRDATLAVVVFFMFVGGASGSTAGGIKLNTGAVIVGFVRSAFSDTPQVTLFRHTVPPEVVTRAFLILFYGLTAVFTGSILLSISEEAPYIRLLFEAVSAFGTVGLSTGVTPGLSAFGKIVIMTLMFIGRLGPLTLVAAAAVRKNRRVEYPRAELLIG